MRGARLCVPYGNCLVIPTADAAGSPGPDLQCKQRLPSWAGSAAGWDRLLQRAVRLPAALMRLGATFTLRESCQCCVHRHKMLRSAGSQALATLSQKRRHPDSNWG